MLNSKQELRKRLHIATPICILVGLYFPTLLAAIFTGEENYYNPFVLLRVFFTNRIVWKLGIIISVGVTMTIYYLLVKTWKQKLYEDKLAKKREFSLDYQPYGDAHWAEPCEYSAMAKVRPLADCKGTILGQLSTDCSQCVDMFKPPRINKHVLAIGSSGSGKSFSLVEPYIMQAVKQGHSLIVTDPKGELYSDTAGYLEDHGYIVRRFDLITLDKSDGWDCMKFLRGLKGDELETQAQVFATIIVTNIEKEESVYSRGSIALLKALILYVILKEGVPDEEKTIARVNEMLQQNGVEYFEHIFGPTCPEYMRAARSSYLTFAQASPNLHGNIVSHLATGMQILQTSSVEKILSTDDIDLNLPGDRPCAYFCRFSATNSTFRFVSAMFFSMSFISLIEHADKNKKGTKKLDVPVDYVMDEFPSIGKIPDYLEKISNIRSYGITAVMICQGISQIKGNYGDDATMIIGNCGTILNIGMNDEETAKWFETRMGVTSIKVATESIEAGGGSMMRNGILGRESRGVGKDFLMSVSDIYNMSVDDTIIIFQHCNPIYAHKVPITAFPEFLSCRKIKESEIPSFDDIEGRRKRRNAEALRIAKYNEEHPFIEPVEDEEYEEPMDFSAMDTMKILKVVIKDDKKDLKRFIKKVREEGIPKPTLSLKKKKAEQEEVSSTEPAREPVIERKPFIIAIDDDDEDGLAEDIPAETQVSAQTPATQQDQEENFEVHYREEIDDNLEGISGNDAETPSKPQLIPEPEKPKSAEPTAAEPLPQSGSEPVQINFGKKGGAKNGIRTGSGSGAPASKKNTQQQRNN